MQKEKEREMEKLNEAQNDVRALVKELEESQGKETKKEILKSLAEYPADAFSPEALEIVAGFLQDPAPSIRARSAALLGHCRSRAHVDALIELVGEKDDNVAYAAALALGEIGEARAVGALTALVARFQGSLEKAQGKKARQQLIEPRIYPGDPARTTLAFHLRDRLGHDKAEARADGRITEAWARLEAVQDALRKCSER